MRSTSEIRDGARYNGWTIDRDAPHNRGWLFIAVRGDDQVTVRFDSRSGITKAVLNGAPAQGRDRRTTVIGWLYDRPSPRSTTAGAAPVNDTPDTPATSPPEMARRQDVLNSARDRLERRLALLDPIRTARVTTDAAPLQIVGELTDGRPYYFRARHGTATLAIANVGGEPVALPAVNAHVPCGFVEVASMTGRVEQLVRDLLVKHELFDSSARLPHGEAPPIEATFSRHDYGTPRTHALGTDGGIVATTVGFTDGAGRHIIDVVVTPHNGAVAAGPDAGGSWHLLQLGDGHIRLVCEAAPTAADQTESE